MVTKELDQYTVDCTLLLKNVTVEDAGKYKVTARNDLGESNATISLNFDSKKQIIIIILTCIFLRRSLHAI